jgi:hypothetical protein
MEPGGIQTTYFAEYPAKRSPDPQGPPSTPFFFIMVKPNDFFYDEPIGETGVGDY